MSFSSSSPPLQPLQEFPTSASSQEASHSSSSRGSYSQVLIVLSIIFVVSIVGCVVGRICFKDGQFKAKPKHGGSKKKGKQGKRNLSFEPNDIDIELGFEHKLKPIPSAKISAGDGFNRGFQPPGSGWNGDIPGRIPGHMEFKNGLGPVPYNTGHLEFKNGYGPGPIPYNPAPMEFRHGPGSISYN